MGRNVTVPTQFSLQSLIEKHFPAPDRSRIQQMLAKQGEDLLQLFSSSSSSSSTTLRQNKLEPLPPALQLGWLWPCPQILRPGANVIKLLFAVIPL
jgi:hypothetical protein